MRGLTLRDPAFVGSLSKPGDVISNLAPAFDFDFSDESTVAVSDNQITQITSKGVSPWALTKSATGPGYVTGINGKKCCDWGSPGHNNYLRNVDTTPAYVAEWYIVLDANFGTVFMEFNGLITGTVNAGSLYVTGYAGTPGFYNVTPYDTAYINNSETNVFPTFSALPGINSPCLLRIGRSDGQAVELTTGFQIGNDRNYPDRGWGGLVGRVIGFSSPLSQVNREAVQNKLTEDWGLTLV